MRAKAAGMPLWSGSRDRHPPRGRPGAVTAMDFPDGAKTPGCSNRSATSYSRKRSGVPYAFASRCLALAIAALVSSELTPASRPHWATHHARGVSQDSCGRSVFGSFAARSRPATQSTRRSHCGLSLGLRGGPCAGADHPSNKATVRAVPRAWPRRFPWALLQCSGRSSRRAGD